MIKKIFSCFIAIIGIAVIAFGANLSAEPANHSVEDNTFRYSAENYDLPHAAFGGDFYTEIYKGSDYIVDVLNDMNKSTETVVKAENAIYEAAAASIEATDYLTNSIYGAASKVIMAIGLGVFAFGLFAISDAFSNGKKKEILAENAPAEEAIAATEEMV